MAYNFEKLERLDVPDEYEFGLFGAIGAICFGGGGLALLGGEDGLGGLPLLGGEACLGGPA